MRFLILAILLMFLGTNANADGDTLTINGTRFRLDGIDAPEIDQNCLDPEGQSYACGAAASDALKKFTQERPINCEDLGPDPKHPTRRIGRCSADGVDLHRWLVKEGWALNFEPYARGRFKEDEAEARAGHFGIWKGCFVVPQDFRYSRKDGSKLLGANCPPDARDKLFLAVPSECAIKGKHALRAWPYQGIYHVPGCGSYRRTTKPDRWFCSEEDALAAGFRRSFTCWLR